MTKTLGIEHAIEFTGFVNDVPARVANLDILVHASTTGEPYGQVIIEGMAAGKPVIATNGGGVPEIVVAGVTGLLVSMDSVDEMTEAIRYLLSDPNVCLRMGRNGRARVLEQFTVNQTAHAVEQVYQELLRDR
jgi:glycosyltransferase involved in cell wall biosynthesis